jgi:hypothetical protein
MRPSYLRLEMAKMILQHTGVFEGLREHNVEDLIT